MSAESGIPTFRDPGGLWDQVDPGVVGTPGGLASFAAREPERLRALGLELIEVLARARPNPAHRALAELEKLGCLSAVITQNGDGLHQEAGNTRVLELHGNFFRFRCLRCGRKATPGREEVIARARAALAICGPLDAFLSVLPSCACGTRMRFDVVFFGEPVQEMEAALAEARRSDLVLVLGTSGVVYPAALVPSEARRNGARLIDINPGASAFAAEADVSLTGPAGELLPAIVERVRELLPGRRAPR